MKEEYSPMQNTALNYTHSLHREKQGLGYVVKILHIETYLETLIHLFTKEGNVSPVASNPTDKSFIF